MAVQYMQHYTPIDKKEKKGELNIKYKNRIGYSAEVLNYQYKTNQ